MAELINKGALIDKFEKIKWKCDNLSDVAQITGVQAIIDAEPTTTEAEIIEKFAEKLKESISPMSHGLGVHDIDRIAEEIKNSCIRKTFREIDTDYIAEQLKEE